MNYSVLIFCICSLAVVALIFYYVFTRKPQRVSHMQSSEIRRNRQAMGEDECCICLSEEKKFQVSITCGHSFCGKCLLDLYDHSTQKLKCPLCRAEINAIFRVFHDEEPKQQGRKISQKIREYNHKFSDNRSFARRLNQFPYILQALSDRLLTREFIQYFFSSANLIKMGGTMLLYLISPIDLLPQLLLGPIGYVDDIVFIIIVFLYTVANSVVDYVRNRE